MRFAVFAIIIISLAALVSCGAARQEEEQVGPVSPNQEPKEPREFSEREKAASAVIKKHCALCHSHESKRKTKYFDEDKKFAQLTTAQVVKTFYYTYSEKLGKKRMPKGEDPLSKEEMQVLADWMLEVAK